MELQFYTSVALDFDRLENGAKVENLKKMNDVKEEEDDDGGGSDPPDVISGAVKIQITQLPGFFISTQLNKFLEIKFWEMLLEKGLMWILHVFPRDQHDVLTGGR